MAVDGKVPGSVALGDLRGSGDLSVEIVGPESALGGDAGGAMGTPTLSVLDWAEELTPDDVGGARRLALLRKAAGGSLTRDVVFHLPTGYADRREIRTLRNFVPGNMNTFRVFVHAIVLPRTGRGQFRVTVRDASGEGTVILFNAKAVARFTVGEEYIVSGQCENLIGQVEMVHPEFVVSAPLPEGLSLVAPQWPAVAGLSQKALTMIISSVATRLPLEDEWLDARVVRKFGWPTFNEAVVALQAPLAPPAPGVRDRLAYDEAFCRQLAFQLRRSRARREPGRRLVGAGNLRREALRRFGYPLTAGQQSALEEVLRDMGSERQMHRLVHGEVSSGKTIIAVLAMLAAVEAGAQAALLVPTDLLAQQHFRTISALSPVPVAILTGSMSKGERRACLQGLASGEISIVVGTQSLFQQAVRYHDLGLIVIDEQHRFGVEQRTQFSAKGRRPDTLLMSATPIPRTVFLAQMGWMDVTALRGTPPGRLPVRTTLHSVDRLPEVVDAVGRTISAGARVYWVCPVVEETLEAGLAAAQERFVELQKRFGDKVALIHGQQSGAARDAALKGFADGRYKLLVGTTVIEVGVDIPEATVMVVEHAERFGAAQLHQLRGRIGRGTTQGYCLLVHANRIGRDSFKRLVLLRDNNNGFRIAEADFRARGGGDLIGKRQSGLPDFRVLDPVRDAELVDLAARDAAHFLSSDPELLSRRGQAALRGLRVFGVEDFRRYANS
jgi:ATP-dependent DNA helicase RecG